MPDEETAEYTCNLAGGGSVLVEIPHPERDDITETVTLYDYLTWAIGA